MAIKKRGTLKTFWQKVMAIRVKYPTLSFVVIFVALFFSFYRLFYLSYLETVLHPKIIYVTAYIPYLFLKTIGENLSFVDGSTLIMQQFALNVIIDCCSIEPTAIFCAAVIAYPSPWRKKAKGMLLCIPAFFIINIIRILSLYFFGRYGTMNLMHKMHLEIWQVLLLLIAVTFFLLWLKWVFKHTKPATIVNQ